MALNVSPTIGTFKAPINNQDVQETAESTVAFPLGLTYGYSEDEWGVGAGIFVSGGSSVKYTNIDIGAATGYRPEVSAALSVIEASVGGAYRLSPELKVGVAWRVVMANAEYSFLNRSASGGTITTVKLKDMKDTQFLAFRAGAQYKLDETTELGFRFRSEVNFEAKGKVSGQVSTLSSTNPAFNPALPENDGTAATTFPMALALGMIHHCDEMWDLLAEYEYKQYSRVGELVVQSATFSTTANQARVATNWRDEHSVAVGAEYKTAWPVRFGASVGTPVTNADYAGPTGTGPGIGYSLNVGTGRAFATSEGDPNLRVDTSFVYSAAAGEVSGKSTAPSNSVRNGTYSSTGYTLHLGVAYNF